nr:porin family protein [uncultured Gellertiella sp.]
MFKSLIASAALVSAFAISAHAADLVQPAEAPPAPIEQPMTPVFTWSGGYVGIQGGGTWARANADNGVNSASDDFNGGILGGFAGANFQNGNLVYGIEGDLNYNWNSNSYSLGATDAKIGTDVSGAVRGRLGYAMDNALLYAAGGWTAARGYVDTPATGKDSQTFNGFTVGAGVDYAFTDAIFGRAEYRYNQFGSEDIGGTNVDFNQHAVTVGVGYKF